MGLVWTKETVGSAGDSDPLQLLRSQYTEKAFERGSGKMAPSRTNTATATASTHSTTTATPAGVLSLFGDYELHHSGSHEEEEQVSDSISSSSSSSSTQQQDRPAGQLAPTPLTAPNNTPPPADWPTNHRRMPLHRPINRNRDLGEVPVAMNAPEYVFIQTMLNGCRLMANADRVWRKTGGKINDKIFRYEIGGEW